MVPSACQEGVLHCASQVQKSGRGLAGVYVAAALATAVLLLLVLLALGCVRPAERAGAFPAAAAAAVAVAAAGLLQMLISASTTLSN